MGAVHICSQLQMQLYILRASNESEVKQVSRHSRSQSWKHAVVLNVVNVHLTHGATQ